MDCEEALVLISTALDGELTDEERSMLETHLASCPDCAVLLEELSGQSRLLRELDCEVPASLTERILSQLPEQTPPPPRKGLVIHWRRWGALAACLALFLWAGSLFQPDRLANSAEPQSLSTMEESEDSVPESSSKTDSFPQSRSVDVEAPAGTDYAQEDGISQHTANAAVGGVQYLRTSWTDSADLLTAQYLDTRADLTGCLAQYPEDDLAEAADLYNEAYFENAALIAVMLSENSSSVTHVVESVQICEDGYEVVIRRETPETATDDMASWLILIETEPAGTQPEVHITLVDD